MSLVVLLNLGSVYWLECSRLENVKITCDFVVKSWLAFPKLPTSVCDSEAKNVSVIASSELASIAFSRCSWQRAEQWGNSKTYLYSLLCSL